MQPPGLSTSSGTHQTRTTGVREKFGAEELAIVLSHFDIGIIDSIVEFPRGSRKAPKLLIVCDHGKFLLEAPRTAGRTIRLRSPSAMPCSCTWPPSSFRCRT